MASASGGGGGGGGGAHGQIVTTTTSNTGATGGNGGNGGGPGAGNGGGGGGGAAGFGVVVNGAGIAYTNTGTVSGGSGGAGGGSASPGTSGGGGNGGAGGFGVQFVTGATLNNSGTITGGNGGAAGTTTGGPAGTAGAGAEGVIGSGITVVTSGSITGGLGGDGVTRANAISFTGGANTLTLQTGAGFTGNIGIQAGTLTFLQPTTQTLGTVVTGGGAVIKDAAGTLILTGANTYTGGTTVTGGTLQGNTTSLQGNIVNNATVVFDQASTGTYAGELSGTGGVTKQGVGTLTLTGSNTFGGGLAINQGILAAANVTSLGGGSLTFNGGTLQALGTLGLTNPVTLNSGGGTFDTNGNTVTLAAGIGGGGALTVTGTSTLLLSATNTYTGATMIGAGSTLSLTNAGSIAASSGVNLTGTFATFDISNGTSDKTIQALSGVAGSSVLLGNNNLIVGTAASTTFAGVIDGSGGTGGLIKVGTGTLTLSGANVYTGGTTIDGGALSVSADNNLGDAAGTLAFGGGTLQTTGSFSTARATTLNGGGGTFNTASGTTLTHTGTIGGAGGLTKTGAGTLTLTGNNLYSGGTAINGGTVSVAADANLGNAAGMLDFGGGTLQTTGSFSTSRATTLNAGGGTFETASGTTLTHGGAIGGTGGLTKTGTGTLILSGNNLYSGGTTVSGGILQGTTSSLQGNILNNANVTFNQATAGTYAGVMSGSGSLTKSGAGTLILTGTNTYSGGTTVSGGILQGNTTSLQGNILNNASVVFNQTGTGTYAGNMSGTGSLALQGGGVLTLTGNNTYTGPTTVTGSGLVVNGSLASTVTLDADSSLGGSGTIGGLVSNGAMLAPGNSIGTLNISGNFSQNGGIYVVEANAQGQSDRVNVSGTATINGATVQLVAAPGNYGTSTTYTILNATGGRTGTYSGVSSNFAFLTPSLSYDANNVFLTLALQGNAFSGFGGNTVNQRAVGFALDQSFAGATGDFATVIGALAGLNTQQGPYALNQISGQPYADFGTFNVANNALFMNALGQQMALARGGQGSGQRQALAEACDVAACDGASPFSVWGSVLGGVGSVQGDGNSQTFTYNVGGGAAGIDYRLSPSFLVGLGAGYSNGTQWVDSFQGKGWSNTVSVAAYGSFTQWGLYLDALAGYAYSNNQLQRQISVPGLQPRTANGSTGANQFLAQAEAGYKIGVYAPAAAAVTPFARFQTSSINQAAFNEWGANSLSLNVQQQTTTSVRTVLGADLAGAIGLGDTRTLDLGLRLGWLHEYANTARPITAAFAGAPSASFTVYGATPQRDAAVIGFQASTTVATATQLYLRYDGDIGSGTDNHALNLGVAHQLVGAGRRSFRRPCRRACRRYRHPSNPPRAGSRRYAGRASPADGRPSRRHARAGSPSPRP